MTVVVSALAVVVVLQLVVLVGLLRSHAEVLRQLHELGAGLDVGIDPPGPAGGRGRAADDPAAHPDGLPLPDPRRLAADVATTAPTAGPVAAAQGRAAHDLSGVTPAGEVVGLRTVGVEHDTVAVFLSSSCAGCAPYWSALAAPDVPAGTRVVAVTREEPDEDADAVRDLAPRALKVLMSSAAYEDFEVPGSPYVVHVDGATGRVRGEGTAASWPAVRTLLLRGATQGRGTRERAAADLARERDADRHLLAAGIRPGDASLYRRADGTQVASPAATEAEGRP